LNMEQKRAFLKYFQPAEQSFICPSCYAAYDVEFNRPYFLGCCNG